MTCPHCRRGRVFRDQAGENSCINCGWEEPSVQPDPLFSQPRELPTRAYERMPQSAERLREQKQRANARRRIHRRAAAGSA